MTFIAKLDRSKFHESFKAQFDKMVVVLSCLVLKGKVSVYNHSQN